MYRWYIDVDNVDRTQRRSDVDGLAFHVRQTTSFCVDESITDESDETTFSCWSVNVSALAEFSRNALYKSTFYLLT